MYSGARPPGDDDAGVPLGLDLGEREIGLDAPPGLLHVGVRVGLEVVDDGPHRPARQRRDVDLIAGFAQPVDDEEELEVFHGVAGQDQHALHGRSIAHRRLRQSSGAQDERSADEAGQATAAEGERSHARHEVDDRHETADENDDESIDGARRAHRTAAAISVC